MLPTYTPSGKCSPLTFAMIPVILVGAIVLAVVYTLLMGWIPFLILDAFLVFGFAIGVGLVVNFGLQIGKCRNPMIAMGVGLLAGGVAIGCAHLFALWNFNSLLAQNGQPAADLWQYLQLRAKVGWTVGKHGTGIPITGMFVWIVWVIEAGVILFAGYAGGAAAALTPYCESCGRSATSKQRKFMLPGISDGGISGLATASDLGALLEPQLTELVESESGVEYDVRACPKCAKLGFLTVTRKVVSLNSKKQKETKATPLHTNVLLTDDEMEAMERLEADVKEAVAFIWQGAAVTPTPQSDVAAKA